MADENVVSKRCQELLSFSNYFEESSLRVFADPEKYAKLGHSENFLVEELVSQKMGSEGFGLWKKEYGCYGVSTTGSAEFREELARFYKKIFKLSTALDPENFIVFNGLTSILEVLGHSLADAGDYFLVPTPLYYSVVYDIGAAMNVKCYEIPLKFQDDSGNSKPFELTLDKVEKAYEEATAKGCKIKAIVLFNPHNPLGTVYSTDLVRDVLQFAANHNLHVISDEIYAQTCYGADFDSSVLSMDLPQPQRVHHLWGFSKDFGLSGLRCGVLYTECEQLKTACKNRGLKHRLPLIVQERLTTLLQDTDWFDNSFLPMLRGRLANTRAYTADWLEKMGATVLPSVAGLYVWVSFAKFIKPLTRGGELALYQRFLRGGVHMVPGSAAHTEEPGWFRIVFSSYRETLDTGLSRIEMVLNSLPADGFMEEELTKAVNQPDQ